VNFLPPSANSKTPSSNIMASTVLLPGNNTMDVVATAEQQQEQQPGGGNNNTIRQRKEERRRERRERRNERLRQRQTELANHLDAFMYEGGGQQPLPDLLVGSGAPPPPYTTLPPAYSRAREEGARGRGWRAALPGFYTR
jgi:hypothetical protein